MSSSFNDDSFDQPGGEDPFSYPPLSSQRFDSFSGKYPAADEHSPFFAPQPPSPPLIYSSPSDPAEFSPFKDENPFEDAFAASNGPILPPPTEMHDEGFALREWRRLNALRLEEKEKREKELLEEIINEAAGYKVEFYQKRQITMEAKKATSREKEKIFLASHDKFHAEADKHYWKAIAELIPNEVPTIEKKGKKDQDKKPSVAVIKGPKPGKPTELSRMRQIVLKLKHNTPTHLMYSPSPPPTTTTTTNDANTGTASPITTKPVSVA